MDPTSPRFAEMQAETPDLDQLTRRFDAIRADLAAAPDGPRRRAAIDDWERGRRSVRTWYALTHLRFNQDTSNQTYRDERAAADAFLPRFTDIDLAVKTALLQSPHREEIGQDLSAHHAFALWERDAASFRPEIQDELVEEQEIIARYVELMGSARVSFEGTPHTTSQIMSYGVDADRARRHAAEVARWGWFSEHRSEMDTLFSDLVSLRTRIAAALGQPSFVEVGYDRKRRVDYDRGDVEAFRRQVLEDVVPLGQRLVDAQASALGVDRVMFWDEKVHRSGGAPVPGGDAAWMMATAEKMFDELHPELADFYRLMTSRDLLDLESRDGKAFGGFCTFFPDFGVPYIFANFNGTPGDVRVFTHEMGHAFQRYKSREKLLSDYVGCTSESAEVHSMSLEFLSWPEMERFFGEDADDFRRQHLTEQLLFLPYGVAVDEFQHMIYEHPEASPDDRHAMWKQLEQTYLPWRDFGDLTHPATGGYWQYQRHVYAYPFYYIDYTLAATCALQFWAQAQEDRDGAMAAYVELCGRGGSLPFRELVASAGLASPFEPGCLGSVVGKAASFLGLD